MTGNVTSVSATRRRARYLGYDVRGEQVVFVLDMDQFSTFIDRHKMDESGIQQLKERFRRSVDASAPAIWSKTLVWEHSDSMVVLAPVGKDLDPGGAAASRWKCCVPGSKRDWRVPASPPASAAPATTCAKLQHSYKEAEHALRIGTAFSGPSSSAAFDDLGAYRLLFHLRDQPELRTFCEETIGALEALRRAAQEPSG